MDTKDPILLFPKSITGHTLSHRALRYEVTALDKIVQSLYSTELK